MLFAVGDWESDDAGDVVEDIARVVVVEKAGGGGEGGGVFFGEEEEEDEKRGGRAAFRKGDRILKGVDALKGGRHFSKGV